MDITELKCNKYPVQTVTEVLYIVLFVLQNDNKNYKLVSR